MAADRCQYTTMPYRFSRLHGVFDLFWSVLYHVTRLYHGSSNPGPRICPPPGRKKGLPTIFSWRKTHSINTHSLTALLQESLLLWLLTCAHHEDDVEGCELILATALWCQIWLRRLLMCFSPLGRLRLCRHTRNSWILSWVALRDSFPHRSVLVSRSAVSEVWFQSLYLIRQAAKWKKKSYCGYR